MGGDKSRRTLGHRMIYGLMAVASILTVSANAMVLTPPVRITKILTYTDYGTGDVVFNVDAAIVGCDGFWLSGNDGGFKNAYAVLLMAKASGMSLIAYAYDLQLWPGSTGKYCRVRSLEAE